MSKALELRGDFDAEALLRLAREPGCGPEPAAVGAGLDLRGRQPHAGGPDRRGRIADGEATDGFETVVAAALAGAGLPLVIVNPAQVRHFAQALGRRAKTDPIDAAMIARFVEATWPELRPLPDAATQVLPDLVARRR